MSEIVLRVAGVGKLYTVYNANISRFARWIGIPIEPVSEYWAVQNVDFSLCAGETLALIGQNGAGKSTLLKMITGTVRPTNGGIAVIGRVSAILELGMGFNPEFTGRQNAYHAGGLMGFSQKELSNLMPSIEDFSELGDFFDQPLRVYSSGMQARLAFSLATASVPDILIIDEVLSVGDSYFQHKSFNRIREFRERGTAILFVSHNMGDVRAICDRVLMLEEGSVVRDGPPDEVVDFYNAMIAKKENENLSIEQRRQNGGWMHTISGTFDVASNKLELVDLHTHEPIATAQVGQKLLLRLDVLANQNVPRLVLGLMIRDKTGHVVWGTNTWHTDQVVTDVKVGQRFQFGFSFECLLGPGSYSISSALVSSDTHLEDNFEWQDNAIVFDVVNTDRPVFVGSSWLNTKFVIDEITA
jgi:lipopolysaccharide transport system ATP-binding protein